MPTKTVETVQKLEESRTVRLPAWLPEFRAADVRLLPRSRSRRATR